MVKIGRIIESIILSWSSIADDILSESESHMYINPLIHHYYWARGGDSLLALWRVSNNVNCWSILFFRKIFCIIITILVTEPPSIISIVILNSVPLERADVANMGGGDWRRGHPLNTQCALQCHGIQQTTLQTTADYSRLHCTSVYSSHSLVDEGSAWNTQVDALHTDSTQIYNI